jgi:hypothetical protein
MLVSRLFHGPLVRGWANEVRADSKTALRSSGRQNVLHQRLLVTEYAPGLLQQRRAYIDTSLLLDAKMAIATVFAVLRRSNAY